MTATRAHTPAGNLSLGKRISVARILLPLFGLALAACSQTDSRLDRSSLANDVEAQQAIILPPPGGPAIVGVIERRYANAIQQDIALATSSAVPGQNLLRVQIFGPVGAEGGNTRLPDTPLSEGGIGREMRRALPGIAMQRSPLYTQNSYGPFGYALGRRGARDLCLYAWQRIPGSKSGAPFANMGTVQLRLRLCQAGASEQSLLAVMYGYTVNTSFAATAWNPYGKPPPADPRLGNTGQPIQPNGPFGFEATLEAPPAPPPPPVRRRAPAPARQEIPAPPPGAPVVPPPPGDAQQSAPPIVPPPPTQ